MDEQGKLHFLEVEGDHIQFSQAWFSQNIIGKFLKVWSCDIYMQQVE